MEAPSCGGTPSLPAPLTGGPSAAASAAAPPAALGPTAALGQPDYDPYSTSNLPPGGSGEPAPLISPQANDPPLILRWTLPVGSSVASLPIPAPLVAQLATEFTGAPEWGAMPPWLEISCAGGGTTVAGLGAHPVGPAHTPSQQFYRLFALRSGLRDALRLPKGCSVSLLYQGWRPAGGGTDGAQPLYCFELLSDAELQAGAKKRLAVPRSGRPPAAAPAALRAAAANATQEPAARSARRERLQALRTIPTACLPPWKPPALHPETPAAPPQAPLPPPAPTPPAPQANVLQTVARGMARAESALRRRSSIAPAPSSPPLIHAAAAAEVAAGAAAETAPGSNVFLSAAAVLPPNFRFTERCHWAGGLIPPLSATDVAALGGLGVSPPLLALLTERTAAYKLWLGPAVTQSKGEEGSPGSEGEGRRQRLCVVALTPIPAGTWVLRWAGEYVHHPTAAASGASVQVPLTAASRPAQMTALEAGQLGADLLWRRLPGLVLSVQHMGNAGVFAYTKRDMAAGEVLGLDTGSQGGL